MPSYNMNAARQSLQSMFTDASYLNSHVPSWGANLIDDPVEDSMDTLVYYTTDSAAQLRKLALSSARAKTTEDFETIFTTYCRLMDEYDCYKTNNLGPLRRLEDDFETLLRHQQHIVNTINTRDELALIGRQTLKMLRKLDDINDDTGFVSDEAHALMDTLEKSFADGLRAVRNVNMEVISIENGARTLPMRLEELEKTAREHAKSRELTTAVFQVGFDMSLLRMSFSLAREDMRVFLQAKAIVEAQKAKASGETKNAAVVKSPAQCRFELDVERRGSRRGH